MEQRSATPKSEKRCIVRPILFGFAAEPVPCHNSTGEQCVTLEECLYGRPFVHWLETPLWKFRRGRRLPNSWITVEVVVAGRKHGYGIAQRLKETSDDVLQVGESSLYPALQRLLLNGWVEAAWGTFENNRRAR